MLVSDFEAGHIAEMMISCEFEDASPTILRASRPALINGRKIKGALELVRFSGHAKSLGARLPTRNRRDVVLRRD
jgi:hypothetical protein